MTGETCPSVNGLWLRCLGRVERINLTLVFDTKYFIAFCFFKSPTAVVAIKKNTVAYPVLFLVCN